MKIRASIIIIIFFLVFQLCLAATTEPTKYAIKAGKILTVTKGIINHGVILIDDGLIKAVGTKDEVAISKDYILIDASDKWVMPGMVEIHSHIALEGGYNDMVVPTNPELRTMDNIDPESWQIQRAVASGVTTVHTIPGSGTNLSGFGVLFKLYGESVDEMLVRPLGAMKIAQAYNPERRGGDLGLTRMGMSWLLRQMLKRAKEYTDAWEAYNRGECKEKPEYKPELEKMRKVFSGDVPTIVHTYEGWGVMQTSRMFNDENNLKTVAMHTAYNGHMVAEEVAKREDVFINVGPRLFDFYSARDNRFYGLAAEYYKGGVRNLSINTYSVGWSSRIAPQQELAFQASMSARLGLDDETALKAITINSARALSIDDRVGSLEVGKDADIVIKKGSLLNVTTPVDLVLINGKIVYQRKGVGLAIRKGEGGEQCQGGNTEF